MSRGGILQAALDRRIEALHRDIEILESTETRGSIPAKNACVVMNYVFMLEQVKNQIIASTKRSLARFEAMNVTGIEELLRGYKFKVCPDGGREEAYPDKLPDVILETLHALVVFKESGIDPKRPEKAPKPKAVPGTVLLDVPTETPSPPGEILKGFLLDCTHRANICLDCPLLRALVEELFKRERFPRRLDDYFDEVNSAISLFLKKYPPTT